MDTIITAICIFVLIISAGILIRFFGGTFRAFKKIRGFDTDTKSKLMELQYPMAFVRNLSKEELVKIGALSTGEIKKLGAINDYAERIEAARKKTAEKRGV